VTPKDATSSFLTPLKNSRVFESLSEESPTVAKEIPNIIQKNKSVGDTVSCLIKSSTNFFVTTDYIFVVVQSCSNILFPTNKRGHIIVMCLCSNSLQVRSLFVILCFWYICCQEACYCLCRSRPCLLLNSRSYYIVVHCSVQYCMHCLSRRFIFTRVLMVAGASDASTRRSSIFGGAAEKMMQVLPCKSQGPFFGRDCS
jgi:hypothetical protein